MAEGMNSASVQACTRPGSDLSPCNPNSVYYATRRDVVSIKEKILAAVPDGKEYMHVLSLYIHGMCTRARFDTMVREQLITDELCFLHNELLRAILFNAHFSRIPPPNVTLPRPTPIEPVPPPLHVSTRPPRNAQFSTFTAAELQRLPTWKDLSKRISKLRDEAALRLLAEAVEMYVVRVLERCHRTHIGRGRVTVTVAQVFNAFDGNIPPDLCAKYASCY